MASTNGAVTPHAASDNLQTRSPTESADKKRKREDAVSNDRASTEDAQTQGDILDLLRQYDPEPSFLDYAFDAELRSQPSLKKAKLSNEAGKTATISAKLSSGKYDALHGLQEDAETVSEGMVADIRERAQKREGANSGRMTVDDIKQMQKVQAFARAVVSIVKQEATYATGRKTNDEAEAEQAKPNGVETNGSGPSGASGSGTVLTLFGNAPTPRQLFSSHQNLAAAQASLGTKSELPVDELNLPMGMTATRVMSAKEESKKGPTFEDAFAAPSAIQQPHPPRSHRRSTTRDDSIPWKFKDQALHRNRKGGYTVQSLTVGDWLGYGGVESKEDPASPREKRKQRDRALSSGESSQPAPTKESAEEAQAREEEALFRRAYSSFAPSSDNSKSVVPEETKSMMWWQRVGNKRFNETLAIDPALMDERLDSFADQLDTVEDWEPSDDFEKIIEDLEDLEASASAIEPARSKTDVESVLSDISRLLETLASHQRIRNSFLPSSTSASRTSMSPAPFLASRIGKPDAPAEDEMATYNALRRELAYLVLRLPPYAIAKLDGDQLSKLGVRKLIPFETKDVKGIMEEDQVARLAKYNAMATDRSIASLTRAGSTSSQHYSSMNQRTPAIGSAANTRYGQSSYSVGRPSAQPQYQRSTSNQSSYGTPTNTSSRMGTYGQYSRPGAPQANGQQYYQGPAQPSGSYGSYNPQYGQSTPQTQQRSGYSQPLSQYTQSQAAARNAVSYQANQGQQQQQGQSPFNRTASPIKPAGGYQQPVQPRGPNYQNPQQYAQALQSSSSQLPGSGRTTPGGFHSQPHTPVNGYQRPTPQPIAQAPPRAASGTPQPIAQAPSRAASGTPQPAPTQQPAQAQANGSPSNTATSLNTPDDAAIPEPKHDPSAGKFFCALCSRSFDRPSSYAVHMRTHTGERPFACQLCGKDFGVRSNLNRHLKTTHAGEGVAEEDLMEE